MLNFHTLGSHSNERDGEVCLITNVELHELLGTQYERYKTKGTSRIERMEIATKLIERYFDVHDRLPSTSVLSRMTTLILLDELADRSANKVRHTEYPFLSHGQYKYRKKRERSVLFAESYSTDGKNNQIKTRDRNRRLRQFL